ncbi:hypothetical protein LINGRAHAP2_LOCUS1915 [Linum grandiflorum]
MISFFLRVLKIYKMRGLSLPGQTITDRGNLVKQLLDRALHNVVSREKFPKAFLSHQVMLQSDHCPILLLEEPQVTRRKRPFKFEIGWTEVEGY